MKGHLLFPDQDFAFGSGANDPQRAVGEDLGLQTLLAVMADGDRLLFDAARDVMMAVPPDPAVVQYRQAILQDILRDPDVFHELFRITQRAVATEQHMYFGSFATRYPSTLLRQGVEVMGHFVQSLRELYAHIHAHAPGFQSPGLQRFARALEQDLDETFFAAVERHLDDLTFREGITVSARLGPGNRAVDFVLRTPHDQGRGWLTRWRRGTPHFTLTVPERDESGAQAVSRLRDQSINLVANEVARAVDHLKAFFLMLQRELGFYLGCVNLARALGARGHRYTFPVLLPVGGRQWTAKGLYDPILALAAQGAVVSNDLNVNGEHVVVLTGANQGGKSTYLRSVGLAVLMAASGAFVAADQYVGSSVEGVFSHFRREEDAALESGKLDEELARVSRIVDDLRPGSLVLFNESFATTNEREGTELAAQIVEALAESDIEVFFVTHLATMARQVTEQAQGKFQVLCLRADRAADGQRTFKIRPGEPLATSFGADVLREVFGVASDRYPG